MIHIATQVLDGTHTGLGHEITSEETADVAEQEGDEQHQAYEGQGIGVPAVDDDAAHHIVQVAYEVV